MDAFEKDKHSLATHEKEKNQPQTPIVPRYYSLAIIAGAVAYGIVMGFIFQHLSYSARGDVATAAFLVFVPFGHRRYQHIRHCLWTSNDLERR